MTEAPSAARRFELIEGGSRKFWEITRDGREVTVRIGRIGSDGQSKVKQLASEEAARDHVASLIGEKVGRATARWDRVRGYNPEEGF